VRGCSPCVSSPFLYSLSLTAVWALKLAHRSAISLTHSLRSLCVRSRPVPRSRVSTRCCQPARAPPHPDWDSPDKERPDWSTFPRCSATSRPALACRLFTSVGPCCISPQTAQMQTRLWRPCPLPLRVGCCRPPRLSCHVTCHTPHNAPANHRCRHPIPRPPPSIGRTSGKTSSTRHVRVLKVIPSSFFNFLVHHTSG
jgi:hypothetical protein